MGRYIGWVLAFVLGALVGWWGHTVRSAPAVEARQLIRREERVLAEQRTRSNAAPRDFTSASAYAVRLLRTLEQHRLLSVAVPAELEQELPEALRRCEAAAESEAEQATAEGLRIRATALLHE